MQNKRCIFAAILMVHALALETAWAIELANPSFEILEPTTGSYPSAVGDWSGNLSAIVPAENGIMPLAGNHMLKFLATGLLPTGGGDSIGSTVVQLVADADISPGATVFASAWFNRVAGPSPPTDTRFDLLIRAQSGTPTTYDFDEYLAETRVIFYSDNDPLTWEPVTASLALPAGTTYVAVMVNAVEDQLNNQAFPEFHGHYVDGVSIAIPEPASLSLCTIAAWVLASCRRVLRRSVRIPLRRQP